ncbi:selenium-dependent molybdenum cofactor biosynthesis protein YqeB [Dethiothermospora halolimnae]|uniref:selenium-dependent molybdenum cofactor biosynthesis protein YqeB n=1 Tax=Dethiothermospora halolimnae TaxID=3114390 RepID=UPI003CCBE2DD
MKGIVIVRGGGDIATGVIQKLHRSGFKVLVLEIEKPLVIRRTVSIAQGIFDGEIIIEDIKGVKVDNVAEIKEEWDKNNIPIIIDRNCSIIDKIKPRVLVDAIMAKKNIGTTKTMADITIGLGPGFKAGEDVDVVIESNRGHDLGRLIFDGYAEKNTGIPGKIMGYTKERVIKSPATGIIKHISSIGDNVKKGEVIAKVGEEPVYSKLDGTLRGLIMEGLYVSEGLKIADVDPRGIKKHCYSISEKARAIGGGVLEAILYKMRGENGERRD